jgi:hypothetical protein
MVAAAMVSVLMDLAAILEEMVGLLERDSQF